MQKLTASTTDSTAQMEVQIPGEVVRHTNFDQSGQLLISGATSHLRWDK
jgi:hypothetical protein